MLQEMYQDNEDIQHGDWLCVCKTINSKIEENCGNIYHCKKKRNFGENREIKFSFGCFYQFEDKVLLV